MAQPCGWSSATLSEGERRLLLGRDCAAVVTADFVAVSVFQFGTTSIRARLPRLARVISLH